MALGFDQRNSSRPGPWITIGSFDGIHLGHQKLIGALTAGAVENKTDAIVVTFFPNPAAFFREITSPYYLTSLREKEHILQNEGIKSVLTIKFDQKTSRLSPEQFLNALYAQFPFTCLLIGYDFRMGADRSGGLENLKEIGEKMGFRVRAIEPVMYRGQPVSSSRIRTALINGDLLTANKMLGYPYSIEGEVIHGDGRGRHIGLPTANIEVWKQKLLPATGVYAVLAEVDGKRHPGVVSIGYRPTFYEDSELQTIETHILDFADDVYSKQMKVHFVKYLRPEEKYNSVRELMDQIRIDIKNTREVLANEPSTKDLPAGSQKFKS
jgi:riboflavin kinase/FMN adenylyltransferase